MNSISPLYSKATLLFWLALCFFNGLNAQIIPSSADLSYLLKPNSTLHLTHKVVSKANKKWVVLEVSGKNNLNLDSLVYAFSFTNKLSTPIEKFSQVTLNSFELTKSDTKHLYAFEATNEKFNFLILRIGEKETKNYYTYIINLNTISNFFISEKGLTIPIIQSYASVGKKIKIAKLTGLDSDFGIQFYSTKFPAALPPMASLKSNNPFGKADSTFTLSSKDMLPTTTEGLYSIFEQNNEKTVSFFRISTQKYPQLSSIDEIIEASIFLFTKKEKDKITDADNPKKEFDAFWLENTNSSERAGKMISAYFKRVKESNLLFSTFKEGWKTDMGMLYIIFGPPDKVFKLDSSIEWIYQKTYELPTLVFKFSLKSENLDSEYFELERNIKYQNNWFRAIDLWRKGRKNL